MLRLHPMQQAAMPSDEWTPRTRRDISSPNLDELLEEGVEELGVAEHTQGVTGRGGVNNNAIELEIKFVVPLHQLQDLKRQTQNQNKHTATTW